jgi:hypothetical protein
LADHLSHSILRDHASSRDGFLSTPDGGQNLNFLFDSFKGGVLGELSYCFQYDLFSAHSASLEGKGESGKGKIPGGATPP